MTAAAKTIDDLPHFRVSATRQSESHKTDYQLSGVFDRTAGVNEGQCSLLVPGKDVLIALSGDLKFQEAATGSALFETSDDRMPEVVGLNLTYVDPEWEPYHIWMVAQPKWKWNRTLFRAADAVAKIVEGSEISLIDGEEVSKWIEVKKNGEGGRLSRYYPVFPSGKSTLPPIGPDGVIKGGWSHAHCELCDAHVDAEHYGYLDLGEHWVCEGCYSKYVINHDLSFIQT
jgi:hypothetical protein